MKEFDKRIEELESAFDNDRNEYFTKNKLIIKGLKEGRELTIKEYDKKFEEFIKRLKETKIMNQGKRDRNKWWRDLIREIDELAGDKLK